MKLAKATMLSTQSLVEPMILCDCKKCCKTHNIHTDLIANKLIKTARQLKTSNIDKQVSNQAQPRHQYRHAMQDMQLVVPSQIHLVRPSNSSYTNIDKYQAR